MRVSFFFFYQSRENTMPFPFFFHNLNDESDELCFVTVDLFPVFVCHPWPTVTVWRQSSCHTAEIAVTIEKKNAVVFSGGWRKSMTWKNDWASLLPEMGTKELLEKHNCKIVLCIYSMCVCRCVQYVGVCVQVCQYNNMLNHT